MKEWLLWAELVLAVVLILLVILQPKSSSGMGSMAGEDTTVYSTKRGAERVLHISTIVVAILFAGVAFGYHFL